MREDKLLILDADFIRSSGRLGRSDCPTFYYWLKGDSGHATIRLIIGGCEHRA